MNHLSKWVEGFIKGDSNSFVGTRRQRIAELLLQSEVPLSVTYMARVLGMEERAVVAELDRLEKLFRKKGMKLRVLPARCKSCGATFKKKLRVPSKCPRCHSQWIEGPYFYLKGKKGPEENQEEEEEA